MQPNEPHRLLMLQFLSWLADAPRTYHEVMGAWRSSCPRLTVWEDALADGLVRYEGGQHRLVSLTPQGQALLEPQRQKVPA